MKQTLNLIKNINTLRNSKNINSENKQILYNIYNLLSNTKLISNKNINYFILNKDYLIFNTNYLKFNSIFKYYLLNYLDLSIELFILIRYRDFFFKKVYTNYDLSMLYVLSIINDNTESIFDKDLNSIINIRKPYKASNSIFLRKTTFIDAILKKYIETTLESKVSINFDKYNICFVKKKSIFLKVLKKRMRRINRLLRNSDLSLRTFIRVTFIFMCTKDIDLFSKILIKTMNSMHYKNHRRFLYYLKLFITKSMKFYFEVLKFEGFFFYLSGKISGGGNSKKKHYVVKHGKYSLTNKMLKLKFKKGLIHTKTGVMGYKFMISYK